MNSSAHDPAPDSGHDGPFNPDPALFNPRIGWNPAGPRPGTTPGLTEHPGTPHRRVDEGGGVPPVGPRRLHLVDVEERPDASGKVIGRATAGGRVLVGVSTPDARHHLHVLGPTGTGKSTLLLNTIVTDATAGHGVAVFDPKGDLVRDILARLPASCADRLVLIDPDDPGDAPPALNLLDPGTVAGSPQRAAEHITSVMAKVWSRWWGHRTADIAHHGLLTLAHTPGATLTDLPRLLGNHRRRARVVARLRARLGEEQLGTLADFWDAFDVMSGAERAHVIAPLLAKLRLVLAHALAVDLLGTPATTFTLDDILDGGILLCRLPKDSLGDDGCRLIGSLLLAGLWRATVARASRPEHQRPDATIVIDECQNFLHLPIGLDDALAEARGLRVSFVLAHQYLDQLSPVMRAALDANARTKVYFALAPDDATVCARHLRPYLDETDLIRLGAFEAVLRPLASGQALPPCTVATLPAPRAIRGRAQLLRQAARTHTGLARAQRQALQLRRRTQAGLSGTEIAEGMLPTVWPVAPSPVSSLAPSPGVERAGEHAPAQGAPAQVSGVEEEPWNAPDW